MRVLIINKFLYPNGGSETYIFKLGEALEQHGHEVQYFGMEHEGRCVGNRVNAYTSGMDFHGGSKLSKLTYPIKTIYSKEARVQLRKVLDDFKPDVCHLNNFNYQLTPSIILEIVKWRKETGRDCKIIFTAHDYQLVCPNHQLKNPITHENCEKCLGGHFMNCVKGKCVHGSTAKSIVGMMEAEFWKWNGAYKYIDKIICCSEFLKTKMDTNPLFATKTIAIKKLPKMYFTNITGGEPFIRTDLKDIVRELYKKSDRIVISTNGFFTDRIVDLCKEFPQIGIRISIEGLEQTNNEIRGLQNGYQRGYGTLKKLREMGMKDVGFGMTVQDKNAPDLVPLYKISDEMGMEFATASLHNSFYFVEAKNIIHDRPMVAKNFENLINELLRSNSPKKWFRAYFNHGLINYIYGQKRLLPCDMSFDTFFIDPYGDVMPCNGTKDKEVMGNLNNQTWDELWNSPEAEKVRAKVRCCDRDCWMIGSVSPAMHKYIWKPATWVLVHKFKALFTKHPYSMYELKICRDYRDGKVTKEELDKCSTCDMNCVINNGLSEASKEQLKHKTGEEIVDADIAQQMETK